MQKDERVAEPKFMNRPEAVSGTIADEGGLFPLYSLQEVGHRIAPTNHIKQLRWFQGT